MTEPVRTTACACGHTCDHGPHEYDLDHDPEDDALAAYVRTRRARDALFAAEADDLEARHRVLDQLVDQRKAAGLTQADVALVLGVTQATVSQLESEASNPLVSTLQRHACALGLRLTVELVIDAGTAGSG